MQRHFVLSDAKQSNVLDHGYSVQALSLRRSTDPSSTGITTDPPTVMFPVETDTPHAQPERPWFDPQDITVLFILGGPGSGKGTQCLQLVRDYGFVHLSAGNLLRQEQARPDSVHAAMIEKFILDGQIVPMHVTINLLKNEMIRSVAAGKKWFLIDGFPRKMDQLLEFEKSVCPCRLTLDFYCPEPILIERLLARGRGDDNIDTIRKRLKTHQEWTVPVLEYMEKQGKLVRITCENNIETTYRNILDHISPLLKLMI